MRKKFLLILVTLLLVSNFVVAERYIKYTVQNATIVPGGAIYGDTKLTDYHAIGYLCDSMACEPPLGSLWNGNPVDSTDDHIILTYPSYLAPGNSYGVFFYKPGFIPWEQGGITYKSYVPGESYDNPYVNPTDVYLAKAPMCKSQIDTFSIKNDLKPNVPLIVNMSATLDADTKAALNHDGPIEYVPPEMLKDYFSLRTDVRLEIFYSDGSHAFDDSKEVYIEYSGKENVNFTWTPEYPDDYYAVVSSYVTDEKCLDSEEMHSEKWFSVWEEEPDTACYTMLDDLNATNFIDVREGDEVKISVGKISNGAYDDVLTPLPTYLEVWIEDEAGNILFDETRHVPANADDMDFKYFNFSWVADYVGKVNIYAYGIAEDCPYDKNTDEYASMSYEVIKKPDCYGDLDCGADSLFGEPFCKDDDVYMNFMDYSCVYPGTSLAYCDEAVIPTQVEDCGGDYCENFGDDYCGADGNLYHSQVCHDKGCDYISGYASCFSENSDNTEVVENCEFGCKGDKCIDEEDIRCFDDSDCDDLDPYTKDTCIEPGETSSYCDYKDITCLDNLDCDDGNDYTQDICLNPGGTESQCTYNQIKCINDADCGIDKFIGSPYCGADENVYGTYIDYSCEWAGTAQSSCSSTTDSKIKDTCEYGCSYGNCIDESEIDCFDDSDCNDSNDYTKDSCINPGTVDAHCDYEDIKCFDNLDCDDGNDYTEDVCHNPGAVDSYCSNEGIACIIDADCGIDDFSGYPYCGMDGNLYDTYIDYQCNNAGTTFASCSYSNENKVYDYCEYGCANDKCIDESEINCFDNLDCDDGNDYTEDSCINPGTVGSFCSNEEIACITKSDCGQDHFLIDPYCAYGNVYDTYIINTCNNAGTKEAYCGESSSSIKVLGCDYGCTDGRCVSESEIICFDDSDCGGSYVGDRFCWNGDVYDKIGVSSCKNPGTIESSCSVGTGVNKVESCEFGCEDGNCLNEDEVNFLDDLYVTGISFGLIDRFYVQDQIDFSVTLLNEGKAPIDDLKVSILIYDLGLYRGFSNVDLGSGERTQVTGVLDVPSDVARGNYDVRIVVSNDDLRRVIHREVTIV